MNEWMLWSVSTLSKVVLILSQYFYMTISSYREEDKNRVTLLVWEVVLNKFDAIDGPIDRTWTTSLRRDIRFAYMKYHSNINYVVDIKVEALHITDTTMLRITGSFDDPPDSSQIRSRFVPSPSPQQSTMSASSTTTLSQLQHTTSSNSIAPTSSLSPAVHLPRESLLPSSRPRDSSSSTVFGLGSPVVNSTKSNTINVRAFQFESDTDDDDIPSWSKPLPYGVVLWSFSFGW